MLLFSKYDYYNKNSSMQWKDVLQLSNQLVIN